MNKTKQIKAETLKVNDAVNVAMYYGEARWGIVEEIDLGGYGIKLRFGDGTASWLRCHGDVKLKVAA